MCNHSVFFAHVSSRTCLTVEYFINAQALIVASESFQGNHRALQGRETLDLVCGEGEERGHSEGCGEGGERA